MHTFSENSSGVPAFLAKLWRLVEDEETNSLIYWSAVSKTIQVEHSIGFEVENDVGGQNNAQQSTLFKMISNEWAIRTKIITIRVNCARI